MGHVHAVLKCQLPLFTPWLMRANNVQWRACNHHVSSSSWSIHALHTCTCMSHRICRREACFPYDNNPGRVRRLCHIHHMLAAQPRAQLGQLMYPRIAAPSPPNGPIPPSKNTAHIAVRRTSCRSQRRHCRPVPTGGIAPKRSHKEKKYAVEI